MATWWARIGTVAAMAAGLALGCGGGVESIGDGGAGGTDQGNKSGQGSSVNTGSEGTSGDECSIDTADPCEVCVATSCAAEALACCKQPGCLDIVQCGREKLCSGIDCYQEDTCKAVIDAAGGPAVALEFASPLGDCAIAACADACK
jgi:hypothetical protein